VSIRQNVTEYRNYCRPVRIVKSDHSPSWQQTVNTEKIGHDIVKKMASIDERETWSNTPTFKIRKRLMRWKFNQFGSGLYARLFEKGESCAPPLSSLKGVDCNMTASTIFAECGSYETS